MKVAIFGATVSEMKFIVSIITNQIKDHCFFIKLKGNTGLELVKQALERGHQVTALVRNPGALEAFAKNENFKVIIKRRLLIKDRLNNVLLLIFIKGGQM